MIARMDLGQGKHMRARLAVACLAVIVGVGTAGCSDPSPTGSAHPTATPATTDSASAAPTGLPATAPIPDSAFFAPPANRTRIAPDKPYDGPIKLPSLCKAKYAGDTEIGQQRSRHVYFHEVNAAADGIPEGTVDQTIAVYRRGGASAAIAGFRSAAAACPTEKLDTGGTATYRLLSPDTVGDEALLIEQAWTNPPDFPGPTKSLLSIVRTGDAVTILWVTGWEGIDADPEVTRDYTARAVAAITAWRK
jgi:hypothetical protein